MLAFCCLQPCRCFRAPAVIVAKSLGFPPTPRLSGMKDRRSLPAMFYGPAQLFLLPRIGVTFRQPIRFATSRYGSKLTLFPEEYRLATLKVCGDKKQFLLFYHRALSRPAMFRLCRPVRLQVIMSRFRPPIGKQPCVVSSMSPLYAN